MLRLTRAVEAVPLVFRTDELKLPRFGQIFRHFDQKNPLFYRICSCKRNEVAECDAISLAYLVIGSDARLKEGYT